MKKVIEFLRDGTMHILKLECGHIVYRKRKRPVPKQIWCDHCNDHD